MRKLLLLIMTVVILSACESKDLSINFDDLPEGNTSEGEVLFSSTINSAPPCSTCHTLTDTNLTGPGLGGYGESAGNRVGGESAEEYTFYSIVRPTRHIVTGFSNVMYDNYVDALNEQQIADLIAYLLEQ